MSSQKAIDYLTKQLVVNKNIVTYRSFSRDLGLHVNEAKNELAAYHSASKDATETSYATFLICGERRPDKMDVDEQDMDNGEDVVETTILLVAESDLDNAQGSFSQIYSVHIYSLSPSPIREANLICAPTPNLRQVELKEGPSFASRVGRITGEHVEVKAKPPKGKAGLAVAASSSKIKMASNTKAVTSVQDPKVDKKEETKPPPKRESEDIQRKPQASGKLNWSKAPPKAMKNDDHVAPDTKMKGQESHSIKDKEKLPTKREKVELKRGTKRKSPARLSDSDDEKPSTSSVKLPKPAPTNEAPKAPIGARVKKRVVVSDDEEEAEEDPKPSRSKAAGKAKALSFDSDTDEALRAMMDVDDDQVIKASRPSISSHDAAHDDDDDDDDVEMDSEHQEDPEPAPKPKPRKKKEKKVVPVGRNGFKKRRVVKSRQTFDEKGYMVTEDYSSYESVDEEEQEPEAPPKAKGKRKPPGIKVADGVPSSNIASTKGQAKDSRVSEGSRLNMKAGASRVGKQPSLMNFFGKK